MQRIKRADDAWARKVARLSQKEQIFIDLGGGKRGEIVVYEEELERFSQSTKPSHFHFSIIIKGKIEVLALVFKSVPARHMFYFLFWRRNPEYIEQYETLLAS